jgi:hypothetical protein
MPLLLVAVAHQASAEGNGLLGIYFDDRAGECETTMSPGQARTAYVVFTPDGDTRRGITGAEFRITVENGAGYLIHSEKALMAVKLGDALISGTQMAHTECLPGLAIAIMQFQIQSLSGGDDLTLRVEIHESPSNPAEFACQLVTGCKDPSDPALFPKVCVQTGRAVINSSGAVACGSSSESTDWGRVKALYR